MSISDYDYKRRITYIDLFKSIGIIVMIMGHVGFGAQFEKYIHAFNMPMFFFISGYLYEKKKITLFTVIKKKAKALIIPYMIWGVVSLLVWYLFKGFDSSYIKILLWDNTSGIAISGALWFLSALFISDVLIMLIEGSPANDIIKVIIYIVMSAVGIILPNYVNSIPWAISPALVGTGFMASVYYLKKQCKRNQNLSNWVVEQPVWLSIIISCIGLFIASFNASVNMRTSTYGNILFFYVAAILIILGVFNLTRIIDSSLKVKPLLVIGSDSITFVCLNQICIYALGFVCNRMGLTGGICFKIVFFVIIMGLLYFANVVIANTKLKVLIGK